MKNKIIYLLLFFSLFATCTKDPTGSSGCPPVKNIYFRFTDTFATSLVDVYKQGDTLKLKHNSGTIYYFIAQKPDTGFAIEKPVTGGSCDGDNYYMQYYQIELKPTVQTLSSIFVKVYYKFGGNIASTQEQIRVTYNIGFSETYISRYPYPPSPSDYMDVVVNSKLYKNVGKPNNAVIVNLPINYIYYNREYGLIKLQLNNSEYFELEP